MAVGEAPAAGLLSRLSLEGKNGRGGKAVTALGEP